jgi:hypothetical protein
MTAVTSWAHLYNNNHAVNAAVTFAHFAGVLIGGGLALAADRDAFRPVAAAGDAQLHRWVVSALIVVIASGVLMMLADMETYFSSTAFWIKMGLFVLLVGNGYARIRAEARADGGAWLRRTSAVSAALWLAVLLVSTMLTF